MEMDEGMSARKKSDNRATEQMNAIERTAGRVIAVAGLALGGAVLAVWLTGPSQSGDAGGGTAASPVATTTRPASAPETAPAMVVDSGSSGHAVSRTATFGGFDAARRDLSRFPGSLSDHIRAAIDQRDGDKALALAGIVQQCGIVPRDMAVMQARLPEVRNPEIQRAMTADYLAMQAFVGQCQTLAGTSSDAGSVARELLEISVREGIAGAGAKSYLAGNRDTETVRGLGRDAMQGDLPSMTLAISEGQKLGLTDADQNALRIALYDAASDPVLGPSAREYLAVVEYFHAKDTSPPSQNAETTTTAVRKRLPISRTPDSIAQASAILKAMRERAGP